MAALLLDEVAAAIMAMIAFLQTRQIAHAPLKIDHRSKLDLLRQGHLWFESMLIISEAMLVSAHQLTCLRRSQQLKWCISMCVNLYRMARPCPRTVGCDMLRLDARRGV